jgi:hypothetical protein
MCNQFSWNLRYVGDLCWFVLTARNRNCSLEFTSVISERFTFFSKTNVYVISSLILIQHFNPFSTTISSSLYQIRLSENNDMVFSRKFLPGVLNYTFLGLSQMEVSSDLSHLKKKMWILTRGLMTYHNLLFQLSVLPYDMATESHKKTSTTYILPKITRRLRFRKFIVVALYDINCCFKI